MKRLYSAVLLAFIVCGKVSAVEVEDGMMFKSKLTIDDKDKLRGLYTGLVKSRENFDQGEIKKIILSSYNSEVTNSEGEVSDIKKILPMLLSCLVRGKDEDGKKIINSVNKKAQTSSESYTTIDNVLTDLKNGNENALNKELRKLKFVENFNDKLVRALGISIQVGGKFPQDLKEAFKYIENLKNSLLGDCDDGEDEIKEDEPRDEGVVKFRHGDEKLIFPIVGAFIGVKTNRDFALNNDELASLAGVSTEKFTGGLRRFMRDIEVEGKPFWNNPFSGKFMNKKTVAVLAAVAFGFLYWWYKSFSFTNTSVNPIK